MNLLDDLGNDLAFAFLVEKRHNEKIDSKEVRVFISKIQDVLKPIAIHEKPLKNILLREKSVSFSSVKQN